jgi:heptosyltransferase II
LHLAAKSGKVHDFQSKLPDIHMQSTFKKIIVRLPNWVGDLVMATPVLTDLRRHYPDAEITAMCRSPLSDLLKKDAAIDELFCFTPLPNDFARRQNLRSIIEKIRAGKYDLGLLLTNSFSSAWWFWQGRVKRRLGYRGHWRRILLTDPMEPSENRLHQVESYKQLLLPLGIPMSESAPRLYVSEKEVAESKELLFQRGYRAGQPLIGINPGAAYGTAKCWPPERFRALALRLLQDPAFYVVFFGEDKTASLVKEICRGLPDRAINLAGVTNLRELACLIKDCDVLVTNDSGPMHIAAALDTPVVALFGSTDDAATGPYGQRGAVINKHSSCSPCFKRTCPTDFRCMQEIDVEEVANKTLERRKPRV